ncbi:MAG: tRNA (adenosine(37)-N6)-threonylcarbamoyltransferase complex ATPase subunit type 1 TsaE [Gemmatimonadetes bacterium]|nr:tRNA (adenosine(37)-N6)-threonylcarbamoyltransferase complex ATPase subunit type 1 TsaE [Gemmatimonadota bacterium]|tara:strand:- start:660 stop:1112 length:453 start_codon:yes stop_codon:yes gene_type:complete
MDSPFGTFYTHSPEETQALGRGLGTTLKPGSVVAFRGDLGSGKTCMIQGICQAFQVHDYVTSPTFILINEYGGKRAERLFPIYHFDLYRLSGEDDLEGLGAEEYFYGDGICLVEWAERAGELLPENRVDVALEYGGEKLRQITVEQMRTR